MTTLPRIRYVVNPYLLHFMYIEFVNLLYVLQFMCWGYLCTVQALDTAYSGIWLLVFRRNILHQSVPCAQFISKWSYYVRKSWHTTTVTVWSMFSKLGSHDYYCVRQAFFLWWEVLTVVETTCERLYKSRSFMLLMGSVDVQWWWHWKLWCRTLHGVTRFL
jgi:hypothetical protein